jgi:dihydroorotate dehydrogenase (fumarate)
LIKAGAEGLVLFNRYLAPDIDLASMTFNPDLKLSRPEELGVALRWIAILRDQVRASLAATGGVHDADDVAKALLVGSDAVMIASALLRHGPRHIRSIRAGLVDWMVKHQYSSVDQLKGSMSRQNCTNPEGLTRANYVKAVTSYSKPAR